MFVKDLPAVYVKDTLPVFAAGRGDSPWSEAGSRALDQCCVRQRTATVACRSGRPAHDYADFAGRAAVVRWAPAERSTVPDRCRTPRSGPGALWTRMSFRRPTWSITALWLFYSHHKRIHITTQTLASFEFIDFDYRNALHYFLTINCVFSVLFRLTNEDISNIGIRKQTNGNEHNNLKHHSAVNIRNYRLRNDLYCVGWGVELYSLTRVGLFIHCAPFTLQLHFTSNANFSLCFFSCASRQHSNEKSRRCN